MFNKYYTIDEFEKFNLNISNIKIDQNKMVNFENIFDSFHDSHTYNRYIVKKIGKIPDSPDEQFDYSFLTNINISAVFIDGCKSWYSTRSFCSEVIHNSKVGTYFLFQDYGRFTCFWIPYFTAIFSDVFDLVHVVDSTYVFKIINLVSKEEILDRFKESPSLMNQKIMGQAFEEMYKIAKQLGKKELVTVLINKSAYYAY